MLEKFLHAMNQEGIECQDIIVADGNIHRFRNEKNGRSGGKKKNGWYVLSEFGGAYGDWKLGVSRKWVPHEYQEMTAAEKHLLTQKIKDARLLRHQEIAARHAGALKKVA